MAAHNYIDLTGQKFERLTVLERDGIKDRNAIWKCLCDCGNISSVRSAFLRNGATKSCGCLQKERTSKSNKTHGLTVAVVPPEYKIWIHMKQRCEVVTDMSYKNYGARGISVCERWKNNFEAFYDDMGKRPSSEHSIDRKDVDGNYEPDNCRWATIIEQARNKRKLSTNKSGYAGIFLSGKKYKASISVNNQRIHLGRFSDINDAIKARKEAETKYWNKQPSV